MKVTVKYLSDSSIRSLDTSFDEQRGLPTVFGNGGVVKRTIARPNSPSSSLAQRSPSTAEKSSLTSSETIFSNGRSKVYSSRTYFTETIGLSAPKVLAAYLLVCSPSMCRVRRSKVSTEKF